MEHSIKFAVIHARSHMCVCSSVHDGWKIASDISGGSRIFTKIYL